MFTLTPHSPDEHHFDQPYKRVARRAVLHEEGREGESEGVARAVRDMPSRMTGDFASGIYMGQSVTSTATKVAGKFTGALEGFSSID